MTKTPAGHSEADPASRPRRVTASDVAKQAGVSRSAVSRAFDPNAYLDRHKREIILKTAVKLGYRPNALAASLQGMRSNLVGVIIGDMTNQYDAEFAAMLLSRLNAANKWPLLVGGSMPVTEEAIMAVLGYPLDAMIVRGGSLAAHLFDDCAKLNIPLIFSGRIVDAPFADCVCCRNAEGTAQAVDLLLRSGHKGLGYIGGPGTWSSDRERLSGVTSTLAQNGLSLVGQVQSDFSYEGGAQAAASLLADDRVDGLICANDAMALGALSYVRNHTSKTVPDDVAIVGFDDVSLASWPDFNLTTVRNPLGTMIDEVLRLLEARLADPMRLSETVMINPILKERGTH
ncbi:MAG: LacI family DNA-binding transcriptional regulator [Cohaesibacteraceae bacterium]